jgi:hypothetical protein
MHQDAFGLQTLVVRSAVALVIALAFAPMIRGITADMTATIGQRWPFVLEHCRTQQTPGCAFAEPSQYLSRLASR